MANINDVLDQFEAGQSETPSSSAPPVNEKVQPFIQNDAAFAVTEFIDGVFGGAIRNSSRNPIRALAAGPVGVQAASGANIPTSIGNLFGPDKELPFQDEKTNVDKFLPGAKTRTGEIVGFGANVTGSLLGFPAKSVMKAVDVGADFVKSSTAGARKVKKVQQAFFEFQKQATQKYGQALRGARKAEDFSSLPKVVAKESEAIFEPILKVQDDVAANVPSLNRIRNIAKNASKDNSLDDLLMAKQRLRRTLSVAERKGMNPTDRSKLVNQTIRNIDKAIQRKVPGIADANKDYAMFSKVKEIVEKFEPRFGNMPAPYGTSAGQNFLRKVAEFTEEEIKLLNKFENATSLRGITGLGRTKIVGAAKLADTTDKFGRMLGKLAGLSVMLGGLKALGADKLFFQAADVAN